MEDFEFGLRKSLCLLFVGKEDGAGSQQEAFELFNDEGAFKGADFAQGFLGELAALRRTAFWLDSMPRLVCSTQAAAGPKSLMQITGYEAERRCSAIGTGRKKQPGLVQRIKRSESNCDFD